MEFCRHILNIFGTKVKGLNMFVLNRKAYSCRQVRTDHVERDYGRYFLVWF